MRLISWNVNGIRAVEKRGDLNRLIGKFQPDVLFLQETKANEEQLSDELRAHPDFLQWYEAAEKKGYSGVSIWLSRKFETWQPVITRGMTGYDDREGRIIRVDLGKISLLSIYFPNGGKSEEAWQEKLRFYDCFLSYVNELRSAGRRVIWAGDLNVAHRPIDLARPKENDGEVGFHPSERAWVDRVLADGWVDIWRTLHPEKVSYTWWRVAANARVKNIGWRIDYFMLDESMRAAVKDCFHENDFTGSDHCPVVLDFEPDFS